MITYHDCPQCGARKIRSTVRLCEVCETCEEYESKIAELERERDEAVRERDELRLACDGCADSEHKTGRAHYDDCPVGVAVRERDEARAEVEMLRGVGCRETKADEPESGPCGVCLKCAEERGAEWALDSVGWSRKDDRRSIARRVCADVRKGRKR
jgi:hypothetical protein